MRVILGALTAVSALCATATAQAQTILSNSDKAGALEMFLAIQEGQPPASLEEISATEKATGAQLEIFYQVLNADSRKFSPECNRFREVFSQLVRDLQSGIAHYSPAPDDSTFELGNRLQIEVAAFLTLQRFLNLGAEGGFGVLDRQAHTSCPFNNRQAVLAAGSTTLESLTKYFRAAFGSPGLAELDHSQRRLLKLALADEKAENVKYWVYAGALTAASIALWEFAPAAVVMGVRGIWGFTPRILSAPAMIYAIKVSAITAEGFAFAYADHLASQHPEAPKVLLGSWNEYMDSISTLLESPVHAPQLQLVLLSRVQAMVFGEAQPWLSSISPVIQEEEQRFGSLQEAIKHYRGLSPQVQEKR